MNATQSPARRPPERQYGLATLIEATSVISLLLAVPLIGRLVLGSILLGLAIIGVLMLLQLPLYLAILLIQRARRRQQRKIEQWPYLFADASAAHHARH